ERRDGAPFRADEQRRADRNDVAVLIDEYADRQRLPPVRIDQRGVAPECDDKWWVVRAVMLIRVVALLVRAVLQPEVDDALRDVIAERRGRPARVIRRC